MFLYEKLQTNKQNSIGVLCKIYNKKGNKQT